MVEKASALWIHSDGSAQPAGIKGGPLLDAFHGIAAGRSQESGLSDSGADLGRAYALAVWAYRCIKLRADAVAGVPLVLLDRSGAQVSEGPLPELLKAPGGLHGSLADLLRATEAAYNIWGLAYWFKEKRPGRRGIAALHWLNPQSIQPLIDPVRGVLGYRQQVGGTQRDFAPEQVISFRNFHPLDDLGGLSPLAVALNEVNAELNAARFVAAFFANDARPAGLLSTDQPLGEGDIERTSTWWTRLFRGPANRWRTGIVGSGLRWTRISFPVHELALPELRGEDRRAICAAFGVPAGMAGAWEATTYATAREQKASFYEDTILPQLEYLAGVLNHSLLPHYPDLLAQGLRFGWDLDGIAALRENATDRAQRLALLYEAGLVRRNEVRGELGLSTLPHSEDGFIYELGRAARAVDTAQAALPPGGGFAAALPPSAAERDAAIRAELRQWERYAARRVHAGKAARPFRAQHIPADLYAQISARLDSATTVEQVFIAFSEAKPIDR